MTAREADRKFACFAVLTDSGRRLAALEPGPPTAPCVALGSPSPRQPPVDRPIPVFAAPPDTDRLAIADLRMDFYPLAGIPRMPSPGTAFREIITGLPGQREDHLLAVVVEVDDLGLDLLAGRDHVRGLADPGRGEPADVDDALDTVAEIDVGE